MTFLKKRSRSLQIVAHDQADKVLVDDAQVLNVRWKVSVANPQQGFVTLALSETDAAAIKDADNLSVKARK